MVMHVLLAFSVCAVDTMITIQSINHQLWQLRNGVACFACMSVYNDDNEETLLPCNVSAVVVADFAACVACISVCAVDTWILPLP